MTSNLSTSLSKSECKSLSKKHCQSSQQKPSRLLPTTLLLLMLAGCGTMPPEPPICYHRDFVLQPVSPESQRLLKEAESQAFAILSDNDLILKAYIRELEGLIDSHDEPLGGCD